MRSASPCLATLQPLPTAPQLLPATSTQPTLDNGGVPYKFTLQGFIQWCMKRMSADNLQKKFIEEMTGLFLGLMPPREFLDEPMKLKSLRKVYTKAPPKVDLSDVPFKRVEKDMYEPLVRLF